MKNVSLFLFSLIRIIMLIILSSYYLQMMASGEDWRIIYVVVAIVVFIGSHFTQMSVQRMSIQVGCSIADFIVISGFGLLFPESGYLYLIFYGVLATTVFLLYDKKSVHWVFSLAFVAVWALISWIIYEKTSSFSITSNIVNAMFVFYGAAVGTLIRNFHKSKETIAVQYEQLTEAHDALQDAHTQLSKYAEQVEQLTVVRERTEIAREIHDAVGHKMTALIVQLQVAQEMTGRDADKSKAVLTVCEQLTRDSLNEIRMSVRTLKEDNSTRSFQQNLKELLNDFTSMTNMNTRLEHEGDVATIPSTIRLTIKRIIQEGLTNAKRHGNANVCVVSLRIIGGKIVLEISDDGRGQKNVIPNFGLINMKERVEEHGGVFEVKSVEGEGFMILISFPIQEKVEEVVG